ncbi:MAG: hypothetical protein CSA38_04060 [Flavobacteriales bacterium]|nr:MAG: hypothetical protein CSA38_04060 [Flavobacteriales bacterium]
MTPPQVIHNDVVVYDDTETHLCSEATHNDSHHQNDSEHDKNTKHHHHCNVELSVLTFLPNQINFEIKPFISSKHTKVNSYKSFYTSAFVDTIFQPPKA